ncbi:MAG: hypothetical protein ACM3VT_19885 [Solirubrobacterales bacterium]
MADMYPSPQLDGIRETIRDPLTALVRHLWANLGDNLKSVVVVGSALTDDFQPGVSDINTVALLDHHDVVALNAVASLARTLPRRRLSAPLLMTPFYIERSRDVFGVEFLDFQLTHQAIFGEDPFAAMKIERPDVRLQCERELKAMLVRLRQGYVAAAGDRRLIGDILISTAKGLTPLVRAMLWLDGIDRPQTAEATLQKAAIQFQVDLEAAIAAKRWQYAKPRWKKTDVQNTFAAILDSVDRLTTTVDGMKL